MYRTPRFTDIPDSHFLVNGIKSTDGSAYWNPSHDYVLAGYRANEEHLVSEDSRHGTVFGLKPVRHYRITKKRMTEVMNGLRTYVNGSDGSSGYWQWNSDGPGFWGQTNSDNAWNLRNISNGAIIEPVSTFGGWDNPLVGLPNLKGSVNDQGVEIPWPDDIEDLKNYALKSMVPGIRPANNVSLVNSIYELKDMATLAGSLKQLKVGVKSMGQLIHSLSPGILNVNLKKPLVKLLRSAADNYLQTQFNLLPLVSDILATKQALSDARDQLRQLVKGANVPQKRHFRRVMNTSYPDKVESIDLAVPNWVAERPMKANRWTRYDVRLFSATLEYSYSLPLGAEVNLLGAYADRLGVNLNPRIIWNAIPWSFVVDWALGVGQWLDQWKTRNIEPVLNIRGACYSVHLVRSIATSIGALNAYPILTMTENAYRRELYSSLYSSIQMSGLSLKEFSLAGALAITR